MCLIIASQNGVIPSDSLLHDAYKDNPHGWGVMWAEGGKIHVVKGLREDSMTRNVKALEGKPFVLHTRWRTHGKIGVSNCHPFKVTDDLWIAHNGIIRDIDCWRSDRSDTWHFARALQDVASAYPFVLEHGYRSKLVAYVEKWIGYSNKIAMLRADGDILIANEQAGIHYEGMWLSNTNSLWRNRSPHSYTSRPAYKPTHYYDAMAEAFAAAENAQEFADEQQCDYCSEVSNILYRYEGCDICEECYADELELKARYGEDLEEHPDLRSETICDDGSEMVADDDGFQTGLEEDYLFGAESGQTEIDREIARLRGELCRDLHRNVVCIDRGNYRVEDVPFSTVPA